MMLKRSAVLLLLLAASSPAALGSAHAAIGEWSQSDHARLRLIAERAADGTLDGVIEIEIDPGWKTYWRSPGDSGIPPRLDFSASSGASDASVDFPPPERTDDGFAVSNVYHDRVALPFRFAKADAAAPVRVELSADLGVCDEVCVPVSIQAALDVPAGDQDNAADGLIREARAALPGPGRPGEFEILSLRHIGGDDKNPAFEATVHATGGSDTLLFAETPPDWYPAPPAQAGDPAAGVVRYQFTIDRKTATTPLANAEIRLTLTEGDAATERRFRLDGSGEAH